MEKGVFSSHQKEKIQKLTKNQKKKNTEHPYIRLQSLTVNTLKT